MPAGRFGKRRLHHPRFEERVARRQFRHLAARTGHHHEMRHVENARIVLPRANLDERIGANHEEQLLRRVAARMKLLERGRRKRSSTRSQLQIRCPPPRAFQHREGNHGETMEARRERLRAMRRHAGWNDEQPGEAERRFCRAGDVDVATMNRIEGAAEDADAPACGHRARAILRGFDAARPVSPDQIPSSNSGTPAPATPDTSKNGSFSCAARLLSFFISVASLIASILFAATTCGLAASSGWNISSSWRTVSKSAAGSRPLAPETSTTCTSSFVRSRCRRNWWPRPRPRCAPSIKPGTSAITKLRSSFSDTTPRFGVSVVNG